MYIFVNMVEGLNYIEGDTDVVYEGSDLHKALIEMGYTDFEYKPRNKMQHSESQNTSVLQNSFLFNGKICQTICHIYNQVMQKKIIHQEQLQNILQVEPLLDDHAFIIRNSICENQDIFWKKILEWVPLITTSFATITFVLLKQNNIATLVLASSASLCIYQKHLRWSAIKNMKELVSLQNKFHSIIKKCLKILRYSFKMKLNFEKPRQKFIGFDENKQRYLMPLIETVTKSLEHVSSIYYKSCSIILSILPKSVLTKNLVTVFENETFTVTGEITYDTLKNLYYTYILVQSEMLNLLAIAYNKDTWQNDSSIPELKLNRIINYFVKPLKKYYLKLSKIVTDYYACDSKPVHRRYKGTESKWQDLYTQLDATSHKLQMSYLSVSSILNDIDNHRENETNDEKFTHFMMEKMNAVYKQIDSAKSFAEFSTLLLVRMQRIVSKEKYEDQEEHQNSEISPLKLELPVVLDSDFQILDEVFEEYIKEEYLKPLYEEDDDELLYNQKLNKLMATNFMSELKEALIEKHKTMSERESRALQRMYQNVIKDTSHSASVIPIAPPMPCFNNIKTDVFLLKKTGKCENKLPVSIPRKKQENTDKVKKPGNLYFSHNNFSEKEKEERETNVTRFSINATINQGLQLPSFLKVEEDTFIGSGENSEDEMGSTEYENEGM